MTRAEFVEKRYTDALAQTVFSFSYKGQSYLYGRDVEPFRHATFEALQHGRGELLAEIFGFDPSMNPREMVAQIRAEPERAERTYREFLRVRHGVTDAKIGRSLFVYATNDAAHARMNRVRQLRRAKPVTNLETRSGDYRAVPIDSPGVIYCDPPYLGTEPYPRGASLPFDYEAFYSWCEAQTLPVFISEFWMPPERFVPVLTIRRKCSLGKRYARDEILFRPRTQLKPAQ